MNRKGSRGRVRQSAGYFRSCLAVVALATLCHAEGQRPPAAALAPLIRHVQAHRDGTAPSSLDFSALEGDRAALPIGVFDSGIGGLTVMEAILKLDSFDNKTLQPGADGVPDFAGEKFIYLGDQANMPYGNYPAKGHEDFLQELIVKDAVFLLGKRYHRDAAARFDKPPVKALVIACNTATAYGIGDIRAALSAWKLEVPVIGVVEAGARAVSENLPSAETGGTIAVLATVGTCSSEAYPKAIGRAGGLAGKGIPRIIQQGCVGLAGAIEGQPDFIKEPSRSWWINYRGPMIGSAEAPLEEKLLPVFGFDPSGMIGDASMPESLRLNSAANYVRYEVTMLMENYRKQGGGAPVSTVVLGCTHFPIVELEIARAFARLRDYRDASGSQPYRDLIAERMAFANPAEFTAKELFRELARCKLRAAKESPVPPVLTSAFVSVPNARWPSVRLAPDGSLDAEYKYGRAAGRPADEDTMVVSFAEAPASLKSLIGLADALPKVWAQLHLQPQK